MRPECVVRRQRLTHQIRPLRLDAIIDVLSEVAVRESVEATVVHRCHVVRNEIAAEFITLVHHGPERAGFGFQRHPDGVAQTSRQFAMRMRAHVDFPDRGATAFIPDSVLSSIAVRADANEQLRAVRTRQQTLGPVMIEGTARQVDHFFAGGFDARLSCHIRKADQCIGIRDVQRAADKRHSKW